jgi:hypothetical protein
MSDGALILLWALLPAIATLWASEVNAFMGMVTLAGILTTYGVALLLRGTNNWSRALMALVAFSTLAGLVIAQIVTDQVASITDALSEMLKGVQEQASPDVAFEALGVGFVIGLISYVIAINSVLGLVLARWWQSLLYNPGGFQQEFHQLRLSPVQGLICFAAVLYCWTQGGDYQAWSSLFAIPLLMVGIAMVHFIVKARNMGGQWLVLFYMALLLVNLLTVLLVTLAVMDTWTNFRARIQPK